MKLTKWNRIFKRSLSALLALIMVLGMVPVTIFATEDAQVMESAEVFSIKLELSGVSSGMDSSGMPENVGYYAACGDSITHANHALVEDIAADDKYYPIDGYSGTTYARKNYAYYIAQRNNLQWANYGYGGTTLHHCYPKGYGGTAMRTFPFVDERITQLKEDIDWDYISIFFGYNDAVYGPAQQRDFWLTETYGEELGYPVNDSQIGTEGFANAEQKAACDAATGSVGGVAYSDNTEYFFAKFVGTVDDTETTTFLGAYNYALDYLTKKYPAAKIMIVNPYVSGTNNTRKIIRDGVNAVAEKWGVSCMDFSDLPYWFYRVDQKRIEYPNPHREDGRWYAENGKANFAGTVEGFNRARFTTDGTHPSNLGYQTISQPMERFLIGSDNTVNVLQGEPFEAELILDDIYTGMDVSVTMGGTDITDQCYANGKIRIASVTGNVIICASGNIAYTDGHTYSASVTPPTCTEQGYTTYTCECGNSYVDDYVEAAGHSYENGICTLCGADHPNLVNFEGKVISILGGSNCTFAGYIPVADGFNLEHRPRYPQENLLTDVNETWWMQVINELDAKLGINDSWAGSQVLNTLDSNSGDLGPDAAMASLTRIQNLGANGTPDVILFFGGCNDIGRSVTLGSFDPATAPTQADLTATKWDSFADAYVAAITRMQHFYPDARILVMLPYNSPTYFTASKVEKYGAVIRAICDHYGVAYVDLRDSGIGSSHLPDNIHPNAAGSDCITAAVLDALLSSVELEAGEHTVYPVTHELTGAKSSLSYYKGVSAGKPFDTVITGDDITVTVTMGGVDITDQVYAEGRITIPAVTGEIVITARGRYNADGRLQQLPEHYCCGTNLWTALEPVNEYYTANGWGNNSNSNYSVTFPVAPGDQIWATSFGAAGTNGYSANAVRITWFGEDGVLESLSRDAVYAEFVEYGYITVPEGAVAVNIPMASNADTWELYILSRDHVYANGACTVCGSSVLDGNYTHAIPENQGVQNAIDRAYSLTDVEWTPLADVPGVKKINGEYTVVPFEAGVTYRGIPYSGTTSTDTYVGLNVTLESFLTALENKNSVLYTENLFSTNPKSASYFGTVCSKFAQYVLDVPGSYNTNNVANIPGMETIALPGAYTVDQIKLGDVILDVVYHTAVCTDILYDEAGNVAYIEISEAVMPLVRRKYWTVEEFYEHFDSYRLCRYAYIDQTPALPETSLADSYALMPRFGDKYNYKVSSTKGVVDVLEEGYARAVILRDGQLVQTIELKGATSFEFDRSIPGHLEMYLEKADGTRSGSVYAQVVSSSLTVTDSSCFLGGKLTVSYQGSSGVPLYVQLGSGQNMFCELDPDQADGATITFRTGQFSGESRVRVAFQNEYGIYLSAWTTFTVDYDAGTGPNPSSDPLISQATFWEGHNITPSNHLPVIQENKPGYWSYTMIPVAENTTYYSLGATRLWYLDSSGNPISTFNAYKEGAVPFQFTTPQGAAYVNIAYSPNFLSPGQEQMSHPHNWQEGICTECGEADPDYHIPGDITGDGEVDNKDLTRLFRYLSDYDVEVVEAALDVNGDGEVDNKDLTRLFRYLSNYDVEIH